jgi:hypothetical protein
MTVQRTFTRYMSQSSETVVAVITPAANSSIPLILQLLLISSPPHTDVILLRGHAFPALNVTNHHIASMRFHFSG